MADVKICDRCKNILSNKRAALNLKAVRYRLGIEVFKEMQYFHGENRETTAAHDLCENCTKKLVDFLDGKAVEACDKKSATDA